MKLLNTIRILSRKSDLANIQAKEVGLLLKEKYPELSIEYITKSTSGDKDLTTPLSEMSEPGVFTDDLRKDLLNDQCDLIVHSWKDLPIDLGKESYISGTLKRADQRDIIFFNKKKLEQIKNSKTLNVLSSSPRRIYNLQYFLPKYLPFKLDNINFQNIRGNIPTRINKFLDNDFDAIVIAKAAIDRLINNSFEEYRNLSFEIKKNIEKCLWMITPLSENPTSPGQGALGIETKKENNDLNSKIASITSQIDIKCVNLERDILKNYGGGCHQKIGVSFFPTSAGLIHSEKGETEDGNSFAEWEIYKHNKIEDKKVHNDVIFPNNLNEYNFFDRIEVEKNSNKLSSINNHCIWITRSSSLPEKKIISKNNIFWASGLKTWQKLAERGYWVNGSAEGLGEDLDPNISSLTSFPWVKLTHEAAPESRIKNTIKTYKLIEKGNSYDFKDKKYFYWMSFSAFYLAINKNPNILDAYHACGPGNTYKQIKKMIKDPAKLHVYLSYEDWKNGLINE